MEAEEMLVFDDLLTAIFSESDGAVLSDSFQELLRYGDTNREAVLNALFRYSREGRVLHYRSFVLADAVKLVRADESRFVDEFRAALADPRTAYWAVDGLAKTAGADAFPDLVDVVTSTQYATEVRANAAKQLALHSGQRFDRDLPSDPGHWKKKNLRVAEIVRWSEAGFPRGAGYAEPVPHPALHDPVTDLDQAAARLERVLASERSAQQDPANPSNWLVPADPETLTDILRTWRLPDVYATFLRQFSPLRVFVGDVGLVGAESFQAAQSGFSYDHVKDEPIAEWPTRYVVIAFNTRDDPYVLDVESLDGTVCQTYHDDWNFSPTADTFVEFLRMVADGELVDHDETGEG